MFNTYKTGHSLEQLSFVFSYFISQLHVRNNLGVWLGLCAARTWPHCIARHSDEFMLNSDRPTRQNWVSSRRAVWIESTTVRGTHRQSEQYLYCQGCIIMATLFNRADHYIFALWFLLLSSLFSSPNLRRRRLDVYHTSTHGVALCEFKMQVWNVLHAAC